MMNRRLFVFLGGALVVATLGGRPPRSARHGRRLAAARVRVAGYESTRDLGEAYLFRLRADSAANRGVRSRDPGEVARLAGHRGSLRARIETDFSEGLVVNVAGWFLSETEATLSAIVAMS